MIVNESYDTFVWLSLVLSCFFGSYLLLNVFLKKFFQIDLESI